MRDAAEMHISDTTAITNLAAIGRLDLCATPGRPWT
jgi:hypothetical protein